MHDLGLEHDLGTLPLPVDIDGNQYFLVRDGSGYRILSNVCPHQGGLIVPMDSHFECPQHGWRFDLGTGQCLSGPSARLDGFPVVVRDGRLTVNLQRVGPEQRSDRPGFVWPDDLRFRLIGHASLEIQHQGFSLLTDPWLGGSAFLGAWITYPPSPIDPATIQPDAIWVSHEHSDHFHPATLEKFSRDTPIYFPDFPNGRLLRELTDMGFTHLQPAQFGTTYEVNADFRITCFEPPGLWNDSIVLIEVGGIRILNINDAGINHRIASLVGRVDILTSAFSPASSYPFAWTHLTDDKKKGLAERSRVAFLRMLQQAVKRYQPRYLLPFASHFALWHPSHRHYQQQLRRNTVDDVVGAFARSPVKVIDVLPGGAWHPASGAIDRGPDRAEVYRPERMRQWLDEAFDPAVFDLQHPAAGPLSAEDVAAYFLRLNDVPDVAFCEDVIVTIEGTDGEAVMLEIWIEVAGGRVSVLTRRPPTSNLTMRMPLNILRHIIVHNASWDEAHVGFWCQFSRDPDVFSAGWWRLLQAPYYVKPAGLAKAGEWAQLEDGTSVADLIERHGSLVERILGRYGLYCAGCANAPSESVARAAERHGLAPDSTERLMRELNIVLGAGLARGMAI
jgi:CMP-N-acetylneuraminate monooxygenase